MIAALCCILTSSQETTDDVDPLKYYKLLQQPENEALSSLIRLWVFTNFQQYLATSHAENRFKSLEFDYMDCIGSFESRYESDAFQSLFRKLQKASKDKYKNEELMSFVSVTVMNHCNSYWDKNLKERYIATFSDEEIRMFMVNNWIRHENDIDYRCNISIGQSSFKQFLEFISHLTEMFPNLLQIGGKKNLMIAQIRATETAKIILEQLCQQIIEMKKHEL